jgi:hypothetical protein
VHTQRVRLAILLPLAALAVWYFLVPAQIGLIWIQLQLAARHSTDGTVRLRNFSMPRDSILSFAVMSVGMRQGQTVTALNIPGLLGEVLISLPTTWPELWHPFDLPEKSWRSFCLPFFCLPAWWFVGRGLESLLGWRRPRWGTLLFGTIICTVFLIGLLALTFGQTTQERADDIQILWGFAFWTLAFGVFPAAWIHRGLTRRKPHPEPIKISF